MIVQIKGTDENLRKIAEELQDLGKKVKGLDGPRDLTHSVLYERLGDVTFFFHGNGIDDVKLNANLPTHRKHFINKAKELL